MLCISLNISPQSSPEKKSNLILTANNRPNAPEKNTLCGYSLTWYVRNLISRGKNRLTDAYARV